MIDLDAYYSNGATTDQEPCYQEIKKLWPTVTHARMTGCISGYEIGAETVQRLLVNLMC
jgi:hypothetical protein